MENNPYLEQQIENIDPSKFRVNYDTTIPVKILSMGYITEKKLVCPCNSTRMSISLILKYQEDGYIIHYDDKFIEDIYLLITLYNQKLDYDHSRNLNLRLKKLDTSLKYVIKKMSKYPKKYGKILNQIKVKDNPFVSPFEIYEQRTGRNSSQKIQNLINQFEAEESLKLEDQVTWEQRDEIYKEIDNYIEAFKNINRIPDEGDVNTHEFDKIKKMSSQDRKKQLKTYDI